VRVAGLILAAGESRRMGRPKALIELDGGSFLGWGIELLRAAGCEPVLVVDGAHRLEGAGGAEMVGAGVVHNEAWQQGPLSSLQVGLRRALVIAPGIDAVLVHHVERPRVRVETLRALLAGLAREPDGIWQPTHLGRSGHPIVWPRSLFDELLALDPSHASARELLRGSAAARRRKLDVDDLGVLDNFDTPDDLEQLHR
jgi:CTP:molybdopterin cytidylyltransferase MocA